MFFGFLVGAGVALFLGQCVRWMLRTSSGEQDLQAPGGISQDQWRELARETNPGAKWLGRLERLLAFATFFWLGHLALLLAGWLVFKIAVKWMEWSQIVRLPTSLTGASDLEYAVCRRRLATRVATRFLVGTLGNLLAGLLGALVAAGINANL